MFNRSERGGPHVLLRINALIAVALITFPTHRKNTLCLNAHENSSAHRNARACVWIFLAKARIFSLSLHFRI